MNQSKNGSLFQRLFGSKQQEPDGAVETRTPPSHLAAYAGPLQAGMESPAVINTGFDAFGMRCGCGSEVFFVSGQPGYDGCDDVQDKIRMTCGGCHTEIPVFYSDRHGYDGKLGYNGELGEHPLDITLACPACGQGRFWVALGFEQDDDKEDLLDIISSENVEAKPEDLFTWMVGVARCEACGKELQFADIECA